jgi:hypothetical protein
VGGAVGLKRFPRRPILKNLNKELFMPQLEDSRITKEIENEMKDLQTVINIVGQIPRPVANRILEYCFSFVNKGTEVLPWGENKAETMKEALYSAINSGIKK